MPRYHFNLHEHGKVVADEPGRDYDDLPAVRAAAVEAARDLMSHEVRQGSLSLSSCIVVEDDSGAEVLRVPFGSAITVTGR